MPTTVTHTLRSSGGDYTTMSAWEAAQQRDLVTADEIAQLNCYDDWPSGLSNTCLVSGWTTDATRYVYITAPSGERHDGTPAGGGFTLTYSTNFTNILEVAASTYATIEWIVSKHTTKGSGFRANSNTTIKKCIGRNAQGSSSRAGIQIGASGAKIYNSHVYNSVRGIGTESNFIGAEVYNCTVEDCSSWGFRCYGSISAKFDIRNCVTYNCTTSYQSPTNLHASAGYNAASDAATVTPPGTNPITTNIVSGDFTDIVNHNYSLASGSTLIDAGMDLSGTFTDDIIGTTRGATFDVGAFEYVGGATTHEGSISLGLSQGYTEAVTSAFTAAVTLANQFGLTQSPDMIHAVGISLGMDLAQTHNVEAQFGAAMTLGMSVGLNLAADGVLNAGVSIDLQMNLSPTATSIFNAGIQLGIQAGNSQAGVTQVVHEGTAALNALMGIAASAALLWQEENGTVKVWTEEGSASTTWTEESEDSSDPWS